MSQPPICWCGNASLVRFNDDYFRCAQCETLVTGHDAAQPDPVIKDDDADFYGRNYWFKHQEQDLGFANIETRARTDLPERCQHWLKTILRHKLPPARTLELGCAHGGFVAMLRTAGFDSMGLELSPAIVDFARKTFDIPMLQGPIEQQNIEPASLDLLTMMDVMEHLPDPVSTMTCCAKLLTPDGILAAQTPRYPAGKSYEEMLANNDPFLEQLKPEEHLFLFSEQAACELFRRIGLTHTIKEPAMFGAYDMFLFASPAPLIMRTDEEVEKALLATGQGRMTLCWLDMDRDCKKLRNTVGEIEIDRATRLGQIQTLTDQLNRSQSSFAEIEADRSQRLRQIETLTAQLARSESDRGMRLEQIESLTVQVGGLQTRNAEVENDRAKRLEHIESLTAEIGRLRASIVEIEADRAKRLEVILELDARLKGLRRPVA